MKTFLDLFISMFYKIVFIMTVFVLCEQKKTIDPYLFIKIVINSALLTLILCVVVVLLVA